MYKELRNPNVPRGACHVVWHREVAIRLRIDREPTANCPWPREVLKHFWETKHNQPVEHFLYVNFKIIYIYQLYLYEHVLVSV